MFVVGVLCATLWIVSVSVSLLGFGYCGLVGWLSYVWALFIVMLLVWYCFRLGWIGALFGLCD